jgi:hypothetical protein
MKVGSRVQHPAIGKAPRRWLTLVVLVGITGFALPENAFADENDYSPTITVLVDNYSQASSAILAAAQREASRIMGKAGLRLVWLECPRRPSTEDPQGPCQKAIEGTDIRLRVLAAPVKNKFDNTVFGFAVHPGLASVYYEYAVRRAKSDDAVFETPIILGCVMAHELGHLLLGSNGHSSVGIMRPRWEPSQFRQLMMGGLLFTSEQSKQMCVEARARLRPQTGNLDSGLVLQSQ